MKNILLTLLFFASALTLGHAQRVLTWSIGEVQVTCGSGPTQLCYPIQVAINDASNSPELATSTIRFYYDAGVLENLDISNTQNGYTTSGLSESNDVFSNNFNFPGGGGVFVQFDLNDNLSDLIDLSTTPTHVMDICFTTTDAASFPLCAPFVFDNNHCGAGQGAGQDVGYRFNSAGHSGLYYLNGVTGTPVQADDEVENFLWDENLSFDCLLDDPSEDVGSATSVGCIEDPCSAELAIIKTSNLNLGNDGVANPGDVITYTYSVTNTGASTLVNVNVNEQLGTFTGTGTPPVPGNENFSTNTGGSSDASVDGSIDVLAPGDVAVFTASYVITQDDIEARRVTNQALAQATPRAGGDPVSDLSDDNSLLEDDPTVTPIVVRPAEELPLMGGAKKVIFALILFGFTFFWMQRNKVLG